MNTENTDKKFLSPGETQAQSSEGLMDKDEGIDSARLIG
jgi:hypothetical protein